MLSKPVACVLAAFVGVLSIAVARWLGDSCPDLNLLPGKHVLITGASSGIGEQLAYKYAGFGARVTLVARRVSKLEAVAARCAELGAAGVHVLQTDMGAPEAASAMPAAAIAESGGHDIDVLILNHAAFAESLTLELENESDMQRHVVTPMRVNYEGTVRAAVAALPSLSKTAGRLVVVSSASAKAPAYFMAGYAASKAALHSFFDAMRAELGVTGRGNVSVTLQVLGMIGTEQVMEEQSLHGIAMPVQECAAAMVCAERSRTHESYIPGYIWGLVRLNVFLPGVTDWAMRTMFVMRVPEYVERIAAAASGIAAA
ncbi:hypothetical protein FNF31_04076 [Cafeteria roenbergensis]|uniref:Uncharacterized protein n=1 Tax=Cafeteria roenbergensis TaxID=33653 RepID=A0A5A8D854_CAFRO|nr:hypothetical protein FNF28_07360 [Cafeteria roenbergensis]KAA0160817.1 hypothetical protein FNF31_04076 [Cafeteria roenbergensis]